jgi:excisionase family DNA binding protein
MTGRLLTAREVAEMLGFSTGTILDWWEAGRLPGFRLGRAVRFRESEVLAWLEAQRVGPGTGGDLLPTPTAPTRGVVSQALPTPLRGGTSR